MCVSTSRSIPTTAKTTVINNTYPSDDVGSPGNPLIDKMVNGNRAEDVKYLLRLLETHTQEPLGRTDIMHQSKYINKLLEDGRPLENIKKVLEFKAEQGKPSYRWVLEDYHEVLSKRRRVVVPIEI
jgi:hypothetical protein